MKSKQKASLCVTVPRLLSWLEVFLGILAGEGHKRKTWDGDQEEALRSVDLYNKLIRGSLYFYRKKKDGLMWIDPRSPWK